MHALPSGGAPKVCTLLGSAVGMGEDWPVKGPLPRAPFGSELKASSFLGTELAVVVLLATFSMESPWGSVSPLPVCLYFSLSCPRLSNYPSPTPNPTNMAGTGIELTVSMGSERGWAMPDSSPGMALSKLQGVLPLQLSDVSPFKTGHGDVTCPLETLPDPSLVGSGSIPCLLPHAGKLHCKVLLKLPDIPLGSTSVKVTHKLSREAGSPAHEHLFLRACVLSCFHCI